nr:hypothetical protein [Tanacetum cinerariifolium]
ILEEKKPEAPLETKPSMPMSFQLMNEDQAAINKQLSALEQQPIPSAPVASAGQHVAPEILAAHNAWIKGLKEIVGLMLMTMEPEIQRNLEPLHAHEIWNPFFRLREIFTLAGRKKGSQLSRIMRKTVNELHAMLKLHEQTLPKNNAPALHAIRAGKVQKVNKHKKSQTQMAARGQNHGKGKNKQAYAPKPKIPPPPKREDPVKDSICHEYGETIHWKRNSPQYLAELLKKKKNANSGAGGLGLKASRKLKPRALSLYVGNGQREAVEAIDAFIYCYPKGWYFEIDLSNSHTNESSIYAISNKRAKLDLDSDLLWHCRLGHISKNRIEKLQHDGLLNSTDLRDFENCVPCMSGKMTRKPYTHQVERAKDLLGLIYTDTSFCQMFMVTPFWMHKEGEKQQAEQELLQATRDFHTCKQEEGQSVSLYVLKMKGYIDNLESLENAVTLGLGYLAELLKKKKNAASGAGGSGIFVIELNTILNRSWIYDTGCGTHICNTTYGLRASRKLKLGALSLYVGNGQREAVEAIGFFYLCLPSGLEIVLNNCHYAPSITRGVISISRLYEDGFINRFVNNTIQVSRNNMVYFSAIPRDGMFEIDLSNSYTNESTIYAVSNKRAKLNLDSALLWHCRLGHISKKCIEKLQYDGLLNSTDLKAFEKCVSYMSGKMARKPYTHQVERAKDLLGLIHTDVCGPFKIMSRQGASYFITFTDDFSRYGYVYLLKHKHEVFETFKVFQKEVENQLGKTIKSLRSNRGGERNKTLLDMVRSMMSQTTLPKFFWDYALKTAARILNMVPTKKVEKTPYEVWHRKVPKLSYLKVWGCEALVKRDTLTKPDKLEPRSIKCIFIGYPKETMRYSFYYPAENKVLVARNAEFLENSLITQEASRSLEDLEIIQEEDTHPLKDTSLNHEEGDLEIDEPQSDIVPIRRSTRTRHAPDHRLVAKGYTQTSGIDYEETFSPVADIRAIRILIAIDAYYDYEIWQIDVKTAFLNGYLNEKVHIEQPKGKDAYILGIKIYRDRSRRLIGLCQSDCIEKILKRYCMENFKRGSSIMYAVRCTRPDVANTKDMFLVYGGDLKRELRVCCYTDAGYLTDADDLKSQTGYVFVLNGGVVDWKSAKQSIFATSSAEAEYIAAFDASKEAVWVRKFIYGLGVVLTIEEPINMYFDNTRATDITNESVITKGARRFHAKVHYLREVIEYGDIKLEKVHTYDNLADPFTKALAFLKHSEHTRNIGMLLASSLM